jgi:hypothetical protein
MAVLRLANGSDLPVKVSLQEVIERLTATKGDAFVELPGDDSPVLVRPSGVIAIIEDSRRGTAGFRFGSAASAG